MRNINVNAKVCLLDQCAGPLNLMNFGIVDLLFKFKFKSNVTNPNAELRNSWGKNLKTFSTPWNQTRLGKRSVGRPPTS